MELIPSVEWEAFRVWMLGTGHSASTTRKTAANLRWFERELGLRLEGLQLSAAIAFVGEHRDDRKPETLNNWVKDLNNWSRFRELGWRLKGFRVGDPPTVLCPTRKEATRVLRRLRHESACAWSAGVAAWDGTESLDRLLVRADGALYRAKGRARGSRVALGRPDPGLASPLRSTGLRSTGLRSTGR